MIRSSNALFVVLLALALVNYASAECANACNGHGRCTAYDMCICQRNWQGNDCSQRVCQYGLAHVDTPKGDLDNSGSVTNAAVPVIENSAVYPYGTTEMYPQSVDSDLKVITNSAHYYMECSNKGSCDRKKGTCKCLPGYDGAACQRASCPGYPNSCSGHGVCKTIKQLAAADNNNIYELWDRDVTMGCECDAGYYGADCSARRCKTGVDPLYLDDSSTIKYPTWNFGTFAYSTANNNAFSGDGDVDPTDAGKEQALSKIFHNGMHDTDGPGYWAIRFYDSHGEDWLTEPIEGGASCEQVVAALEAIPNDVVPAGTVYCTYLTTEANTDATLDAGNEAVGTVNEVGPTYAYLSGVESRPVVYDNKFAFWETIANQVKFAAPADADPSDGLPYSWATEADKRDLYGFVYRLKFFGNPGALKQPDIEIYLDGDRPSLEAVQRTPSTTDSQVITSVWTDGMQGEDKDYIADHCNGVTVNVLTFDNSGNDNTLYKRKITYLSGMTSTEEALLKTCIGGSDFDAVNNINSYDWDYGNSNYPHLIKLVRSVTVSTDGGHYAAVIFRPLSSVPVSTLDGMPSPFTGYFELVNPWIEEDGTNDNTAGGNDYEVYTTKGTLALTSEWSDVYFGFGSKNMYLYNARNESNRHRNPESYFGGGISCEIKNNLKYRSVETHASWDQVNYEKNYITYCMNKTDLFIPLVIPPEEEAVNGASQKALNWNPPALNMYTAEKLYMRDYLVNDVQVNGGSKELLSEAWRNIIVTDISTNWGATYTGSKHGTLSSPMGFKIYKFFPSPESTYEYVAECSNRGICNSKEAVCECFGGYTNDNCDTQSSLAV